MDLRHLRTFKAVASELSFTRAGRELGYVQSAVTAHVKALEADLGVKLFDRLGRNVVLTEAGRELLAHAMKILDLTESARDAVSNDTEPSGTLHVSASESLCIYRLPPVLKEFGERFPEVRVIFEPSKNGTLDPTSHRRLSEGVVDLAFVIEKEYRDPADLITEVLVQEPLVLVANSEHPLVEAVEVHPADLAGESVLMVEKGCGFRTVFEEQMSRAGVKPRSEIEFTSAEAIKRCVESGMGVAVLAAVSVAEEVRSGRLVTLSWAEPGFRVSTQMVRHKDKWLSPTLQAFVDTAREVLGVGEEHSQPGPDLLEEGIR